MSEPAEFDEAACLAEIRRGDEGGLGALLVEKRPQLLAFLQQISSDALRQVVTIEDLYQDLATSACAAIRKVASPDLDPMAWLFQLARRRVADAHRFHFGAQRRSRNRVVSIDGQADSHQGLKELLISSMTSPSAVVSRNLRLHRVFEAMASLGDESKEIVRMRFLDGLATSEIARRLNKSEVAIRVSLSRSLKRLSEMLHEPSTEGSKPEPQNG